MGQRGSVMDELGEVIHKYAALSHQLPPGAGPGEDGEEGTGPTPEQLREMHEGEREDRYLRAQEIILDQLGGTLGPSFDHGHAARMCVAALRKEGLL